MSSTWSTTASCCRSRSNSILPGRSLDELAGELPPVDLERLVMDGGELLARVHSLVPDRGVRHELQPPDEHSLARGERIVEQTLGPSAALGRRARC